MVDRPFLPYGRHVIGDDDIAAVVEVLRSDFLTTGPAVGKLEAALVAATGAAHAVAVANGTAALHAACFAAGLGPGDEVIVPAITFLATANCARYVGASVVFADVDPDTGLVSAGEVAKRCTTRTRAVIPVHLTGAQADVAAIAQVARDANAIVIEDAAHALGGGPETDRVGACTHSAMTIFSFHPVKQITTGEGGAIMAHSAALQEKLSCFRSHGMVREPARMELSYEGPWYYEQQSLGFNYRLSDLQAALGICQLTKLHAFIATRRALAARYDALLASHPFVVPVTSAQAAATSARHLYSVRIDFAALGVSRGALMERMRQAGIGTQVHYIPVPHQPYYRKLGSRPEDFPGAMRYYFRTLSLPLFASMTETDVERVVETLTSSLHALGARNPS